MTTAYPSESANVLTDFMRFFKLSKVFFSSERDLISETANSGTANDDDDDKENDDGEKNDGGEKNDFIDDDNKGEKKRKGFFMMKFMMQMCVRKKLFSFLQ